MTFLVDNSLPIALLLGWLLDLAIGDPVRLPHPIVWFGKWVAFWEKRLNKGRVRKAKGALLAMGSICLTFGITYMLLAIDFPFYIHTLLQALLIFYGLAGHTLRHEVSMVFQALDHSIEEGRRQVSRIVGRDTESLSDNEVRTAALETLAENLSDGVVAPLFWLCMLGVPGMLTYKMVNTLDSMIGYHHPRYKEFGCWAARIDDIANYVPARLTAFMMLCVGWVCSKIAVSWAPRCPSFEQLVRFTITFGPQHASPNSGWPEAALAALLNCRFGGPHTYFNKIFHKPYIGTNPRSLTASDAYCSIRLCFLVECMFIVFILFLVFVCILFANPLPLHRISVEI